MRHIVPTLFFVLCVVAGCQSGDPDSSAADAAADATDHVGGLADRDLDSRRCEDHPRLGEVIEISRKLPRTRSTMGHDDRLAKALHVYWNEQWNNHTHIHVYIFGQGRAEASFRARIYCRMP